MTKAAGSKRRLFSFEEKGVQSEDEFGNTSRDFEEVFQAHGELIPRFGGETIMAARLSGKQPATIVVDSTVETRTVTTDWRIRDTNTNELFNIRSIANPDQRNRKLEFLCESGVAT